LVPPHLTLVFGVNAAHLPAVEALAVRAARDVPAFCVAFTGHVVEADPFEGAYKLFLTCGAGADRVMRLHHQLYDGPHRHALSADYPYRPHMTIATNRSRAAIESAAAELPVSLPATARIGALSVVRLQDGQLSTCATLSLLGAGQG
ncbi:MAG: 2'-5' RNA ligase family protein, partial [Shimia sp.]